MSRVAAMPRSHRARALPRRTTARALCPLVVFGFAAMWRRRMISARSWPPGDLMSPPVIACCAVLIWIGVAPPRRFLDELARRYRRASSLQETAPPPSSDTTI